MHATNLAMSRVCETLADVLLPCLHILHGVVEAAEIRVVLLMMLFILAHQEHDCLRS